MDDNIREIIRRRAGNDGLRDALLFAIEFGADARLTADGIRITGPNGGSGFHWAHRGYRALDKAISDLRKIGIPIPPRPKGKRKRSTKSKPATAPKVKLLPPPWEPPRSETTKFTRRIVTETPQDQEIPTPLAINARNAIIARVANPALREIYLSALNVGATCTVEDSGFLFTSKGGKPCRVGLAYKNDKTVQTVVGRMRKCGIPIPRRPGGGAPKTVQAAPTASVANVSTRVVKHGVNGLVVEEVPKWYAILYPSLTSELRVLPFDVLEGAYKLADRNIHRVTACEDTAIVWNEDKW